MRDRVLHVVAEQILVPSVVVVQVAPHSEQKSLCTVDIPPSLGGEMLLTPRYAIRLDMLELRHPAGKVVVAKPARAFLDIRLQMVKSLIERPMPLPSSLGQHAGDRLLLAQEEPRQSRPAEFVEESHVAGDETCIEQADVELGVVWRELRALARIPDRVGNTELGVPQCGQERCDLVLAQLGFARVAEQEKQVDIGVREELAPSVPAYGDSGYPAAFASEPLLESTTDDVIDRISPTGYRPQPVTVLEEVRTQPLHLLHVVGPEAGHIAFPTPLLRQATGCFAKLAAGRRARRPADSSPRSGPASGCVPAKWPRRPSRYCESGWLR